MPSKQETALVRELAEGGAGREVFRLASPRQTLLALGIGTVAGFLGAIGLLLGWFGVSLEDVAPELAEGLATPPAVLAAVLAVVAVLWLVGLGRSVVREVEVAPGGALVFRTLLREVPVAADDPLVIDRLLGLLLVGAAGGKLVLLSVLARDERLLAHLEAHPSSLPDPRGEGEGARAARPVPVPRDRLDASVWRIVRTNSLAFYMALYGLGAGLMVPVGGLVVLLAAGGEAIRPDGSVRSISEVLWVVAVGALIPPATVAPVVAFRVARWRAILATGEPVPGLIDDVGRSSGELLVRCSFERAGRRHRIKLLVRPTAEAKALRPGPEVIWVRPGRPRQALPQGLFVLRGEGQLLV